MLAIGEEHDEQFLFRIFRNRPFENAGGQIRDHVGSGHGQRAWSGQGVGLGLLCRFGFRFLGPSHIAQSAGVPQHLETARGEGE